MTYFVRYVEKRLFGAILTAWWRSSCKKVPDWENAQILQKNKKVQCKSTAKDVAGYS